jgi:hypothetical protein
VWARPWTVEDFAFNWSRNKVISLPAIIVKTRHAAAASAWQ